MKHKCGRVDTRIQSRFGEAFGRSFKLVKNQLVGAISETKTFQSLDAITEQPKSGRSFAWTVVAGWSWIAACPFLAIGRDQAAVRGRYFSGKNSSATVSCSGTSGKKLSRWQ
jgi:hypothetical protein